MQSRQGVERMKHLHLRTLVSTAMSLVLIGAPLPALAQTNNCPGGVCMNNTAPATTTTANAAINALTGTNQVNPTAQASPANSAAALLNALTGANSTNPMLQNSGSAPVAAMLAALANPNQQNAAGTQPVGAEQLLAALSGQGSTGTSTIPLCDTNFDGVCDSKDQTTPGAIGMCDTNGDKVCDAKDQPGGTGTGTGTGQTPQQQQQQQQQAGQALQMLMQLLPMLLQGLKGAQKKSGEEASEGQSPCSGGSCSAGGGAAAAAAGGGCPGGVCPIN